jgi:hypothetical protein
MTTRAPGTWSGRDTAMLVLTSVTLAIIAAQYAPAGLGAFATASPSSRWPRGSPGQPRATGKQQGSDGRTRRQPARRR